MGYGLWQATRCPISTLEAKSHHPRRCEPIGQRRWRLCTGAVPGPGPVTQGPMWALRRQGTLLSLLGAYGQAGGQWLGGRGYAQAADADKIAAAKRERRKERRKQNRELRERAPECRAHSSGPDDSDGEFLLFQALFGVPKGSRERQDFMQAWKQRQAQRGDPVDGDNGSSSSSGPRNGSAGASAGPRWGQANWTWEDFGQPGSSSGSMGFHWFVSWEEVSWYELPPRSARRNRGWHGAWEQHSSSSSDGTQSRGHNDSGGAPAVHCSMQVLGLERSWLESRCGRLLRQAYLAKAKEQHPDMHVHAGSGCAAAAEQHFKKVQAAYQALLAMAVT